MLRLCVTILVLAGLPFFRGSESFFESVGECAELGGCASVGIDFGGETSHFAFVHADSLDRETDAAFVAVNLHDASFHFLAHLECVTHLFDVLDRKSVV